MVKGCTGTILEIATDLGGRPCKAYTNLFCGQVCHNGHTCDVLCPAWKDEYDYNVERLKHKRHQLEEVYQCCIYLAHIEG